jgi:hypothetical protein
MTQEKRMSGMSMKAILGFGAVAGVIGAATASFTTSEALLRSSFVSAIAAGEEAPAPIRTAKSVPLAGSEDFWLSAMRQDGRGPLAQTVAIGDQITMTLGGVQRQLDVTAVSEFEPKITTINTASTTARFVLVTAKDGRDTAARPIRFVMEIESAAAPVTATTTARALGAFISQSNLLSPAPNQCRAFCLRGEGVEQS